MNINTWIFWCTTAAIAIQVIGWVVVGLWSRLPWERRRHKGRAKDHRPRD